MSNEYKFEPLKFQLETYVTDEGNVHKTISIYIGDEEIVSGARSLSDAIQEFDWFMKFMN